MRLHETTPEREPTMDPKSDGVRSTVGSVARSMAVALAVTACALAPAAGAAQVADPEGSGDVDSTAASGSNAVAPVAADRASLRVDAVRVDEGPRIDGALDEAVWSRAAVVDGFVQQEPDEGVPVSERTEVRILYDGGRLYLGVAAYDREPEGIIATEMRRDAGRILDEDNVQVILDTYRDRRAGYMFVVSPLGAKLDQQISGEGGTTRFGNSSNINRDWDGVWDVATRQTSEGWFAEIEIPMVTLRFPEGDPQTWGINFMRNIRRKNEQAYWAPIPQAYDLTRVSLAGELNGLQALSRGRDLRIKPYVAGGGRRVTTGGVADDTGQGDVGVDLKYGVTASLNLDVTVNTDFAQAEVDDERVNLTRFALFYPEKRDFFLENAGQFTVGTTTSIRPIADLFFSRRIGLSEAGRPVPILGGTRLTGKVGGNNIAVMDIVTDDAQGVPGENFLVARYSRDIFDRSRIGGIFIDKRATGGDHYNRTYGVDVQLAPLPALTIDGFLAGTSTRGPSGDDVGGHFRAGWLDRSWRVYTEYTDLGDDFNPEVGFVPRVGIRRSKLHLEYNPRPDRWGIRVLQPMWNVEYYADQTGRLVSRRFHHMVGIRLEDGGYINVWYNRDFERLDEEFRLRPDAVIEPGAYSFGDWNFSYRSNPAQRIYYGLNYSPSTFYDGDRTDMSVQTGMRVTDRVAVEGRYSRNEVRLPDSAFDVDIASVQLDLAFSPTMSLRTRTQYNSSSEQWTTSARFRYIYRPGSDLYIVYDEVRRDPTGLAEIRDRQLVVKMTYLVSM